MERTMHREDAAVKTGFETNSQEISYEMEEKTPFHKNKDEIFQGHIIKPGNSLTNNIPSSNIMKVGFDISSEKTSRPEENSKKEDDLITDKEIEVENPNKTPKVTMKPLNTHPSWTHNLKKSPDPGSVATPLTHPTTLLNHHFKENLDLGLVPTPLTETETYSPTTHSTQSHEKSQNQDLVMKPPTPLVTTPIPPMDQTTPQATSPTIHQIHSLKENPSQGKTLKRVRKVVGNQGVDRPKIINGSNLKKKVKKLKERVRKKRRKKTSSRVQVASQKKNNLGRIRKFQVENQDKEGKISTSEDMEGTLRGGVKHHTSVNKKTGSAHNWNDPTLTLILEERLKSTRVGIKIIPTRRKFYFNEGTRISSLGRMKDSTTPEQVNVHRNKGKSPIPLKGKPKTCSAI